METKFATQLRVRFHETDMAGIVHFSNFFKFMEEAEHAFLRSRGLAVSMDDGKGKLGFPKVSAVCDYLRPARCDDMLDVELVVRCSDGKCVDYECMFFVAGKKLAMGQMRVAFCRFLPDKPPYAVPITDEVLRKMFDAQMPGLG